MNFSQWVAAVQGIARQRDLVLETRWLSPSAVHFSWFARNLTRFGSGGAGAGMIGMTSPQQYTWDWYALPDPPATQELWDRRGRYVPRIPARAVSLALKELF